MTAPSDARALTLLPHWAHAIAWLGKPLENRTRPIPAALVGQRVAIHAGARLPERLVEWGLRVEHQWIRDLCLAAAVGDADSGGFSCGYVGPGLPAGTSAGGVHWRSIATRAIVATAVLSLDHPRDLQLSQPGSVRLVGACAPEWADLAAPYWWHLRDVIALAEPVPVARGQLGLWRLAPETVDAIDAAGGWG